MSDTYYGLSKMEYDLMKFFWNNKMPVSLAEVLKYCNTELHYDWASSTLSTYLSRLVKKAFFIQKGKGIDVNVTIILNLQNKNWHINILQILSITLSMVLFQIC